MTTIIMMMMTMMMKRETSFWKRKRVGGGVKEAEGVVLGSRFEVEKRLRLRLKKRSGKTIHFLLDSFHHRFPSRSLRKRTKPRLRIMAAPQRVLYWGSGSAPAWRVMITLAEKKLVRGEQRDSRWLDRQWARASELATTTHLTRPLQQQQKKTALRGQARRILEAGA
jgi:hypothetical protein